MRLLLNKSSCLLAIGLGMLFLFHTSASTKELKESNVRIKELQQKRLAVLEEFRSAAKAAFGDARVSYEDVHTASAALLSARLEYASTREERIKACDQAVKEATEWLAIVGAMKQNARALPTTELKAEADLLELQIQREKLELTE